MIKTILWILPCVLIPVLILLPSPSQESEAMARTDSEYSMTRTFPIHTIQRVENKEVICYVRSNG